MRRARAKHSFIYAVTGHDGAVIWYLIRHGLVRAAIPAPHDLDSREAAATLIESLYQKRGGAALWPNEEIDGVLLVAGWFRRHPAERSRTIPAGQALAYCHR